MRRIATIAAGAAVSVVTVAGVLAAPADAASQAAFHSEHVCARPSAGYAACAALVRTDAKGQPLATSTPSGYGPSDLHSAYNLPTAGGAGKTVAIVDAYDDPTAASDLNVYRSQFGLPACGAGCFTKVNQSGGTTYPRANGGWAQEISLDLDMVSAICPDCHILLVEASSSSLANLATAVGYAASVNGVVAISNSYGGSDGTNNSSYESAAKGGIAVTASTGDNGYGVESPASYSDVVAVGGTTLNKSGGTYSETAWSGAGSGCSTYNANPGWQTGTSCVKKANADVSAVANPNTGVSVYDSTQYQGRAGWLVFGGTSVASPIIASVYALADNFGSSAGQYTWGHAGSLNDVTSGSNGSCSTAVWCHAGTGWDGPTGLGTPNGTGAF